MTSERWNYLKNLRPSKGLYIHVSAYLTTNFLGQRVVSHPRITYRKEVPSVSSEGAEP